MAKLAASEAATAISHQVSSSVLAVAEGLLGEGEEPFSLLQMFSWLVRDKQNPQPKLRSVSIILTGKHHSDWSDSYVTVSYLTELGGSRVGSPGNCFSSLCGPYFPLTPGSSG